MYAIRSYYEYDPNRTANIALLHYLDGEKRYIIAPVSLKAGDMVESGEKADINRITSYNVCYTKLLRI